MGDRVGVGEMRDRCESEVKSYVGISFNTLEVNQAGRAQTT